jgi:hypothetical protein
MSTPTVTLFELDRPRHFRLSWREIKTFERLYQQRTGEKLTFMKFVARQADWTVEDMQLLVYVGFAWEDYELTEDMVLDIFGLEQQMRLNQLIGEIIRDSLPEEGKKKLKEMLEKQQVEGFATAATPITSPPGTTSSSSPGE